MTQRELLGVAAHQIPRRADEGEQQHSDAEYRLQMNSSPPAAIPASRRSQRQVPRSANRRHLASASPPAGKTARPQGQRDQQHAEDDDQSRVGADKLDAERIPRRPSSGWRSTRRSHCRAYPAPPRRKPSARKPARPVDRPDRTASAANRRLRPALALCRAPRQNTRFGLMPISFATSRFCAAARIALPRSVVCKKIQSAPLKHHRQHECD